MSKIYLTFFVLQGTLTDRLASAKKRHDAGQGSLEYVAMIAVAALIIVAVVGVANTQKVTIGKIISDAVTKVTGALGA